MSGYSEMTEIKHDLGEGVKPTTEALPMYHSPTGYQASPGYHVQQGGTAPAYHTTGQYQTTTETSAFQEACCFPVEDDTKKEDDDDTSIIPEKYLNLEFDSCFHEHKSTRTIPIVYKINGYIFKYTKLFFYNFLVILFGFFLSFLWAIVLGITSFALSWMWNPGLKALIMVVSTTLPAVTEPLKALFTPLVDVQARVFRQIRVQGWLNGGLLNPLLKKEEHVA